MLSEIKAALAVLSRVLPEYGPFGLFVVSFVEASFFPIPPDAILIPLAIASPGLALAYALLTTIASTLGAVFGYYLGYRLGHPLAERFASKERIRQVEELFGRYGGWAVAIAAFTPIPFKVFTICSGIFRISRVTLVVASLLGRGARFFLEAVVIIVLGKNASYVLARYLGIGTTIAAAVAVIGYYLFAKFRMGVTVRLSLVRWRKAVFCAFEGFVVRYIAPLGELGTYLIAGASLSSIFVVTFAHLADELLERELEGLDSFIIRYIREWITPGVTEIMKVVSFLGSSGFLLFCALALGVYFFTRAGGRPRAYMLFSALAGSWIINEVLKEVFKRPRPDIPHLVVASGYSFPSGHAMVSSAFYAVLAYILWTQLGRGRWKGIGVSSLLLLILVIGLSRIYLGVHYPSDILAGFAAGGLWATVCIVSLAILERRGR